jgi:hypothetical protein
VPTATPPTDPPAPSGWFLGPDGVIAAFNGTAELVDTLGTLDPATPATGTSGSSSIRERMAPDVAVAAAVAAGAAVVLVGGRRWLRRRRRRRRA